MKFHPALSFRKPHAGDDVMLTKSKAALAVAVVLGSTSLVLAQGFDPNLANRYPHLANPQMYGYVAGANAPARMDQTPSSTFQSAPVHLRHGRNGALQSAPVQLRQGPVVGRDVGLTNDPGNYTGWESEFDIDRSDRASSPYAGGG
jgi:hypothetical protein